MTSRIQVRRTGPTLLPDQRRVLLRPFLPGDRQRIGRIVSRVLALPEEHVGALVKQLEADFSHRHQHLRSLFLEQFEHVRAYGPAHAVLSEERQQLVGSCFLAEYSLESAALFNPSIVRHPDQSNVPPGALRFVLSLRATGEGHISSITFREGMLYADNTIEVFTPAGFLTEPRQIPTPAYEKALFARKLTELGLGGEFAERVMGALNDTFAPSELRACLAGEEQRVSGGLTQQDRGTSRGIWMLARSNYEVQFQPGQQMSDRILFPATPSQRNGIEDARFVLFRDDDGREIYYATFTAYDGRVVIPELVETSDFLHFRFLTLNGPVAENKGMAIFPRKIGGRYAMLSRQDNENMYLMFSDNVHFWNERDVLLQPVFPWELVQLGNCGSPLETEAGWLVLIHGVGPMRKYCISAILLDLEAPCTVIGRLTEPLLEANGDEREGYVPNVVYTCGALLHNGQLIVPYGRADHATAFVTIALEDILARMQSP